MTAELGGFLGEVRGGFRAEATLTPIDTAAVDQGFPDDRTVLDYNLSPIARATAEAGREEGKVNRLENLESAHQ